MKFEMKETPLLLPARGAMVSAGFKLHFCERCQPQVNQSCICFCWLGGMHARTNGCFCNILFSGKYDPCGPTRWERHSGNIYPPRVSVWGDIPRVVGQSCSLPHALFAAGWSHRHWSAQGSDRDGRGRGSTYERTELLLAYEIVSLINAPEPHQNSASAWALLWAAIGPLVAFVSFFCSQGLGK